MESDEHYELGKSYAELSPELGACMQNPKQNINKSNIAIYKKDNTDHDSRDYSRNMRLF